MTQDEIIEMARQAHFDSKTWVDIFADNPTVGDVRNYLIAFAKLVAVKATSAERDACSTIYAQLFTDPENQPTQYGTVTLEFMDREIAKEREACARVCESINSLEDYYGERTELACAEAIRARGQA